MSRQILKKEQKKGLWSKKQETGPDAQLRRKCRDIGKRKTQILSSRRNEETCVLERRLILPQECMRPLYQQSKAMESR